jgi:hypothetical protein
MTDTEVISQFTELFRGRGDCYGSEEGGCVRQPLTKQTFGNHLGDGPNIGVYPAVPRQGKESICVWGCSDIDVEDLDAARLLQRTLEMAGVVSWVERSRSKGYHVWVFASEQVPAESMRRMLLVVHQVAAYPAREVNPKQSNVSANKVGNYVRLPYPGGLVETPVKRVILDDNDQPIPLRDWLQVAISSRVAPVDVERIASMYVEPARQNIVIDFDVSESLDDALRRASPMIRTLWRDGPLPGKDRSRTLMFMAYACQEMGMTPSMCHAIISDSDRRWGKYTNRGQLEEIDKIVSRAFGGR